MTEKVVNCYCDILSEHNNQKVPGASTVSNIVVMIPDPNDDEKFTIERRSVDMCEACRAKYGSNLYATYNSKRQIVYSFSAPEE